ncbi:hypothetical protein N7451_012706 [Penicillium sp. IBT 35674x]|nr:hypothetical protein N7451_012706 [Penicillium sp. IBT 35674x]
MATTSAARHILLSAKCRPRFPFPDSNANGEQLSLGVSAKLVNGADSAELNAMEADHCFYPEKKEVQQQKELTSMRKEMEGYKNLLEDIYLQGMNRSINERLAKTLNKPNHTKDKDRENSPFSCPHSAAAPMGRTEVVYEDFNRSEKSRATGYMGKSSEVAWMQQLDTQAPKHDDGKGTQCLASQFQFPMDNSIASMNYRLDYQGI